MRLYGPKPKKFWMPAIIAPPGGRFIASLAANYQAQFYTSNVTSSAVASFDFSLTIPGALPAGSLLVLALHTDRPGSLTSVTFDPAGQNIVMTQRGTGKPYLLDCVLPSGLAAGTYVFRAVLATSNWQFSRAGLVCWNIVGQTVNAPEAVANAPGGAVLSFGVTAGRAMLASACWSSNQTMTWSLSNVAPSTTHGSGTQLGAAEWTSNLTTTAGWTVASAAGNPTDGTVAATYR